MAHKSRKPVPVTAGHAYVLAKQIAAIPAVLELSGVFSLDAICKLPEGRNIEICGEGFSSTTVRVLSKGKCYFVFADDLKKAATLLPEQIKITESFCKQCSVSLMCRPSGMSKLVYPAEIAGPRLL